MNSNYDEHQLLMLIIVINQIYCPSPNFMHKHIEAVMLYFVKLYYPSPTVDEVNIE